MKFEMLPVVLHQPSASTKRAAPIGRCRLHKGTTPQISGMGYECASAPKIILSGSFATFHQFVNIIKKRLIQLRKVGNIRQLIIHLKIDVQMIICIPGRLNKLVPDALQIGRVGTRTRRSNQQVTSILKQE